MRAAVLTIVTLSLVAATPAPPPSAQSLLRDRVKYVFVIYQENRSFDHYFGTYPGANGIYSPDAQKHGFRQYNPVAKRDTQAFRIATSQVGVLSNARKLFDAAINNGAMDGFVTQEAALATNLPPDAQKKLGMTDPSQAASVGDESMAHVDCDTIPYLWNYASRFALFDSFFQGARGPSTPSNVEIVAAQNGETEYERYGSLGPPYTEDPPNAGGRGVPIWVDLDPAWGPYNTEDFSKEQPSRSNLRDGDAQSRRRAGRRADQQHAGYRQRHRISARQRRKHRSTGRGTSRATPIRPTRDASPW